VQNASAKLCTENDPKKIISYWTQCLRESMLRDPNLKTRHQVKIEQVLEGRLPQDVVEDIQACFKTSGKSQKTRLDPKSRMRSVARSAGQTSERGTGQKRETCKSTLKKGWHQADRVLQLRRSATCAISA